MQYLSNIPTDFTLTTYFKPFYELYSVKSLPAKLSVDIALGQVLNIVNTKAKKPPLEVTSDDFCSQAKNKFRHLGADSSKKAFIAFSGGKDCLATAIRAEEEGYSPTLVYISGINKGVASEKSHAFAIADAIGYPIISTSIRISEGKDWNEHPLKNILILCLLVDIGTKLGVTTFGLGNLFEENSTHGSLNYDLSDSYDMIKLFNTFCGRFIPNYKYLTYIHDNLQSFYTVYKRDRGLINLLSTCIVPDYRRPSLRNRNVSKFGADCVLDGCGSCYKCADLYLFRRAFGLVRHNSAYAEHCMKVKAKFDTNYVMDFDFDRKKYNRYGGHDTEEVQVLCDRCGYYIGRLIYDKKLFRWFVNDCFGSKHYPSRTIADKVCKRFKRYYKLL